jgi:hypothetical protein
MAKIYDSVDLLWSSRGDYYFSEGDLMDTDHDPLRSLSQEINTRLEAETGDWTVFPDIGANLSKFVGEPNTPVIAEAIKISIQAALTRDGFIANKDITIRTMPLTRETLMVRLSVKVAPTNKNASSEVITKNILYNYSNNNVYFMGV